MDQSLLLVHAHPDDESINNGVTMAKYAARGTRVTLVTCTLGEEGEVLVPELAHLAADKDDALGAHRVTELAHAMMELGVTDHRFLGGEGRYRDSGMVWHEDGHAIAGDEVKEGTFWRADLTEAADHLVAVIREVRPQVLVTYDQFGNYGHPDHIQVYRVGVRAAELAGTPAVYESTMNRDRITEMMALAAEGMDTPEADEAAADLDLETFGTPGELITTTVDVTAYLDQKRKAMAAHASQISESSFFLRLDADTFRAMWGTEWFVRRGAPEGTREDWLLGPPPAPA